jgi:AraC-like DNA-binding protein
MAVSTTKVTEEKSGILASPPAGSAPTGVTNVGEELFSKIIELFPFPIQVFTPDGTAVYTNNEFFNVFKVPRLAMSGGKHNILKEPSIDKWGIREHLLRAFRGEPVQIIDIKLPGRDISRDHGGDMNTDAIYQDIYTIPVFNGQGLLAYVAAVFITMRIYHDRDEILKSTEYIERHWLDKFDIDGIAGAVGLSKYHFARSFKKQTGMTPYAYYQEYKIKKLKEKLCDARLSVSRAFSDCGLNYSGNFARIFKERVGLTPSQYRASMINK